MFESATLGFNGADQGDVWANPREGEGISQWVLWALSDHGEESTPTNHMGPVSSTVPVVKTIAIR